MVNFDTTTKQQVSYWIAKTIDYFCKKKQTHYEQDKN